MEVQTANTPTIPSDINEYLDGNFHSTEEIKKYFDMFEEMLIELSVHEKNEKFRNYFQVLYAALEKSIKNEQSLYMKCDEMHREWLSTRAQMQSCARMAADEHIHYQKTLQELEYEIGQYQRTMPVGSYHNSRPSSERLTVESDTNMEEQDYIPQLSTAHDVNVLKIGGTERSQQLATPVGQMTLPIPEEEEASFSIRNANLVTGITGIAITEPQLRKQFADLDIDGNGWLSREEVRRLYLSYDNYGLVPNRRDIDEMLNQCRALDDGRISFDEFCIIMLKVAKR